MLVFRAPRVLSCGPGCSVCRWAAARPRAVRAASLRLGASSRSPARPRRRPRAPQPGPTFPRRVPHTGHTFVTVRCLSCSPLSNFARNSPADRLYIQFASLELQRLWAISKNDRVKLRATFGRDPPTTHEPLPRPGLTHPSYPKMSHVIPLHIFQTLKSDRWNCNVCGPSRKMTELNYVRLLLRRLPPSLSVPSTDDANCDQD